MKRSISQNQALFETCHWLRQQYEDEKKSAREIAKILGCEHTTVWRWLGKFGIKRRTISESKTGAGHPGFQKGHKTNVGKHRSSATEFKGGENHFLWTGGCEKYWSQQARKIWEGYYGYRIPRGFAIHHRDQDTTNNNIENIVMLPRGLHSVAHVRIRRKKDVTA